jgi:hypothetical protein
MFHFLFDNISSTNRIPHATGEKITRKVQYIGRENRVFTV